VIDVEFQAAEMNGFAWSEADNGQVPTVGNEGEFQ
jgi:hypothetical protein